jgi:predicted O-methyltransferase YrrM
MNELNLNQMNQSNLMPSKINLKDLENIEGFSWPIQLALIDLLCRYKKPKNALEIGTWHGRSAVIFASYVNDKQGLYWGLNLNEPEHKLQKITVRRFALMVKLWLNATFLTTVKF